MSPETRVEDLTTEQLRTIARFAVETMNHARKWGKDGDRIKAHSMNSVAGLFENHFEYLGLLKPVGWSTCCDHSAGMNRLMRRLRGIIGKGMRS